MNRIPNILALLALTSLLYSCSGSQNLSSYDDIYYTPSDDLLVVVDDEYIDIDERDYSDGTQTRQEEEYYDPDFRENESNRNETIVNNYYQDDFYHSNRLRRFNSNLYMGFNYYDPFFSYNRWNTYDPFFWRPRPLSPFAYRPGWGFGWNSTFGWTASLGWGYGAFNPYGGFGFNPYGGFGYNPWGYYGNVYCPPFATGFAYNDFYAVGPTYYRGQYNQLGSLTSSSSSTLGRGDRDKALELSNNSIKPYNSASSPTEFQRQTNSISTINSSSLRPRESGIRPVDSNQGPRPQVAGVRPVDSRPIGQAGQGSRPSENTRPNSTRPVESQDYVKPQNDSPRQVTRPIRDDGNYRQRSPEPRSPRNTQIRNTVPRSNSNMNRSTRTTPRNSNIGQSNPVRSSGTMNRGTRTKPTNTNTNRGSRRR
ncbi:MAG: hypothetical protein HKN45_08960 [Flavobacteriales bacterium]|nr:hypothetical protein [Flavobacteriales bacterium]